jgi:hypothetical protein
MKKHKVFGLLEYGHVHPVCARRLVLCWPLCLNKIWYYGFARCGAGRGFGAVSMLYKKKPLETRHTYLIFAAFNAASLRGPPLALYLPGNLSGPFPCEEFADFLICGRLN